MQHESNYDDSQENRAINKQTCQKQMPLLYIALGQMFTLLKADNEDKKCLYTEENKTKRFY